ncbi:MAG: 50S ribosomal protein L21 [Candidatus Woesebacteria bacterium GW2011_GWB1_41_10]|uniref:Large ribosomal subunit protein bL21 n=1 Tax=Candidatus Woesebacteria bacterium GW2011_GWB1_41_10 TaxID=1618577 RepID=A0A0G0UDF4_9BACT|nr:MAG: 50S ribosomal protein L21 [Candidatus Woesebacteria bacterium GW2011_GWB1_41_10]
MQKYAIIRLQGKQYRVSEKDEILVDKILDLKKVEPEVLLISDDGKVKVGKPVLKDVKVKTKILVEMEKGEKIDVYKFKAKSRYRRHTGFRPHYTKLLIEKISI